MKSKRFILFTLAVMPLTSAFAAPASLANFDADVAACRRTIRQACAIVQELAPQKTPDAAKQKEALALVAAARTQWADVAARHSASPPTEYAADKAFAARFSDIGNSLEDMERALAAGQARRSLLACGFGCGQFVAMHEENGLEYALDGLFALRKTAKTGAAVFKTRGLKGVAPMIPQLLRQRDDTWLAPLPWPAGDPRNEAFTAGLRNLSAALDRLAAAIAAEDAAVAGAILNDLVPLINKPYGLAL